MTDRYRKKPVEVRAWKIGFDRQQPNWVREAFDGKRIVWCPAGEGLYINTLEGCMKANVGDMLIEGVKGELYGCRADIFAATYEPVEPIPVAPQQPTAADEAMVERIAALSFPAQPATELRRLHAESERDVLKEVVAWARPVYARPVNTPDTGEWDELVDIEFHTRPEKPEGEGWRPLVVCCDDAERDALNAENERLRNLLRRAHPIVQAHARASHLLEGLRPKRNQWDELVDAIDAALRNRLEDKK